MIFLKETKEPLFEAFEDEIEQIANDRYQLVFKFPLSSPKWRLLTKETLLLADDLHGEQEFRIFEVAKRHGYVRVYANQVTDDLNYKSISSLSVDRVTGQAVMSALAGSIIQRHSFSFFSDISDRHSFNQSDVTVMDALSKGKHSIIGQWGGELVRDKYQLKLLKKAGEDSEVLFMYKKNLAEFDNIESVKGLITRLHLKCKVETEGRKQEFKVTVDSPLINQYQLVYEANIEVQDQDVTSVELLRQYGVDYFRRNLPDIPENSLSISVADSADYPVRLFDTAIVHHERHGIDMRLQITSYKYSPMAKRLRSVGFGKVKTSLMQQTKQAVQELDDKVAETVLNQERQFQKELENANRHFEAEFEKSKRDINDSIEVVKAKAEDVKTEITSQINADIRPLADEAKRLADGAVVGLARQRGELEAVRSSVGTAKAEAIREAGRLVDVAKGSLAGQLSTAKAEAIREATNKLNTARQELTGLVDGAKREARELVDGLSVGGRNYLPYGKAFWEVGAISGDAVTLVNHAHFRRTRGYIPVSEGEYTLNAKGSYGIGLFFYDADNRKVAYSGPHAVSETFWYIGSGFPLKLPIPAGAKKIKVSFRSNVEPYYTDDESFETALKTMKLEKGNVATDWSPAPEDYSHTLEQLDNGYREKFRVIEGNETERRAFQTEIEKKVDGFRTSISSLNQKFDSEGNLTELSRYKNERQETDRGINQKLTALETYKDGESDRSRAYFEASRDETAKQLREERKVITDTYVAKNQYEDDARGITRRFEAIKVGGRNYVLNSKEFRGGRMTLSPDFVKDLNTARVMTLSLTVSGRNLSPRSDSRSRFGFEVEVRDASNTPLYCGVWYTGTEAVENKRIQATHRLPDGFQVARVHYVGAFKQIEGDIEISLPMVELSSVASAYRPAEEDFRSEFATYKQGVDGQLATLTRQVGTTDGAFTTFKNTYERTAQEVKEKLTALETYKDGESNRSRAYFEASRDETAKQLREERKVITDTYVAKNQYEDDARGITRRFEAIKVGGRNYILKSDVVKTASSDLEVSSDFIKEANAKRYVTLSCYVTSDNLRAGGSNKYGIRFKAVLDSGREWVEAMQSGTESVTDKILSTTWKIPEGRELVRVEYFNYLKWISGDVTFQKAKLECSSLRSDWSPAEEDFRSEFATYKQGVDGQLSTLTKNLGDKVSSTTFKQTADEIKQSVSTLDGQVMKSSNFTIDENGLVLQSGREFNGSTITSLLTVNPDNIKAITDKMIITPAQRNLVLLDLRTEITSGTRYTYVTSDLTPEMFDEPLEFAVLGRALRRSIQSQDLWLRAYVQYTDNAVYEYFVLLADGSGTRSIDFEKTLKIPKKLGKTIREFRFSLHQKATSGFARWNVSNLRIYHKTSASLLVDGSIEARHIKAGSIEAGHIKAGSITAEMIEADTIKAKHLDVDQALINKLTVEDLLVRRITASEVFATQVQAVDLSASRIRSGVLASRNGATSFNLDTGELLFYTDSPAIKRIARGYPNQFVKFATGYSYQDNREVGVTVIGSNRDGSENANNGTFAGIRIWNGSNLDQVDIVGDTVRLASSAFENQDGWEIKTTPNQLSIDARRAQDRPTSVLNIGDVRIFQDSTTYISLRNTINLIVDNLSLLHKNKQTEHEYYYTLPSKI